VIAAIYVDGGWEPARKLVLQLVEARIIEGASGPGGHDYKTRLQELATQTFEQLPRYQVRHEGPDHSKRFFANVLLRGETWGTGEGRSKKQAEQSAARVAWSRLRERKGAGGDVEPHAVATGTEESPSEEDDAGVA
jgi:ribonuclease-3